MSKWSKWLAGAAALCTLALPASGGEYLPDDVTGLTEHLFSGGPGKDGIPALTNPVFGRPEEADYVREDDLVMGVFRHGVAKAYPENLGWWHEVINDEIGGQFISVTLCPLTGTALNFNATGDDLGQIEFGVSGQLINSNLVMYDRRDGLSLYPQMIYTGISGNYTGEKLELLPIVETTWSMWKQMYPGTEVALSGTGLDRYDSDKRNRYLRAGHYEIYPYGTYREDHQNIFFPMTTATPDLEGPILAKETVLGICRNGEVKSYPFKDIPDGVVINDAVGGDSLLVVFDRASRTAIPYSRMVGGVALTFVFAEPQGHLPVEFVDVETRSRWNMLGEAVSGELKGTRLEQIPAYNSMWFAWDTYWNGAPVWEGEGVVEELPDPDTAVELEVSLPGAISLTQNYPNPFNPGTHIQYGLPRAAEVDLTIYNAAGQQVRTLASGFQGAGRYVYRWDARDDGGGQVASGSYLCRLLVESEGVSETRVMTLVR